MKKRLWALAVMAVLASSLVTPAQAFEGDTIKVGLHYGGDAMFAANLQNADQETGYAFGWFDEDREFQTLGSTQMKTITTIAAGDIYMDMSGSGKYSRELPASGLYRTVGGYHVELQSTYADFETASAEASHYGGWPAYIDGTYVVRVGSYQSSYEAENQAASLGGTVVTSGDTGYLVTETGSGRVLFEYDYNGQPFGVMPATADSDQGTWSQGLRYRGGFEYARKPGGNLSVINVVDLEEYVKGVVPHEMSGSWPLAALEAQAVCARTFAKGCVKHVRDGFDVCSNQHCQMYQGRNGATEQSDRAVENTAGQCIYYNGTLVPDAVYHSANGGATEDGEIIWGGKSPYLKGKPDPYESQTNVPNATWSTTYTASELTWILEQKGYSIGQVRNVYVSKRTPNGNVQEVTFEGNRDTLRITGEKCRTIFYSSTYNKSAKSQRYEINGGSSGGQSLCINDASAPITDLTGITVLSGSGQLVTLEENIASVITSSGVVEVSGGQQQAQPSGQSRDSFTLTGTGNGHNVGMSQYGAKAMAELGYTYQDILQFYYTDITIE